MDTIRLISTGILFLLSTWFLQAGAQGSIPVSSSVDIFLATDRNLYVAGEFVHFTGKVLKPSGMNGPESQVMYVELITPDGKNIVGNKFEIQMHEVTGCVAIPTETVTGIYFLRAYTREMRNQGPGGYAHCLIKIVNFRKEGISVASEESMEVPIENGFEPGSDEFLVTTDRKEFLPGEMVHVEIKSNPSYVAASGHLSVSVIPAATYSGYPTVKPQVNSYLLAKDFLPETRGVTISGEVKEVTTGRSLANARVSLTLIGAGRDFMAVQTDSTGHFLFTLPAYKGSRELFLSAEHKTTSACQVFVDNDYCTLPVRVPAPKFLLSQEERDAVLAMSRNLQIRQHFEDDSIRCIGQQSIPETSFYGVPSAVLKFDAFIQLPTLEEYFNELPTPVKVRRKAGRKYFKVTGSQTEMNFFEPLVLVDWVAVHDPDKILAALPSTIDRIEVITVPYVKGDITYGGIISILTKKGNFGGIDLPSSGIFLNYQLLSDSCPCEIPMSPEAGKPDARNTLYWNPGLQYNRDVPVSFSFRTPDTPGAYQIVVQGLDAKGEWVRSTAQIVVKGQ